MNLFSKYGGYRKLDSYTVASVIQLGTWRFCTTSLNMLGRQKEAQGEAFRKEGGFRERLTAARLETRDQQQVEAGAPVCPECGKSMRQRTAKAGPHAGQPFWGCTGYPACKGVREVDAPRLPSTPADSVMMGVAPSRSQSKSVEKGGG
jgi:four helix bundle suffix protein